MPDTIRIKTLSHAREIELYAVNTKLYWRHTGNVNGTELFDLATLGVNWNPELEVMYPIDSPIPVGWYATGAIVSTTAGMRMLITNRNPAMKKLRIPSRFVDRIIVSGDGLTETFLPNIIKIHQFENPTLWSDDTYVIPGPDGYPQTPVSGSTIPGSGFQERWENATEFPDAKTNIAMFDLLTIAGSNPPARQTPVNDSWGDMDSSLGYFMRWLEHAFTSGNQGAGAEVIIHTSNPALGGPTGWSGVGFREGLDEYEQWFMFHKTYAAWKLRRLYPTMQQRPVWIMPIHRFWARLYDDLALGLVPDATNTSQNIEHYFIDDNTPTAAASYGLAMVAAICLWQVNPTNGQPYWRPDAEVVPTELAEYMARIAYEECEKYYWAGLGGSDMGQPGWTYERYGDPFPGNNMYGISPGTTGNEVPERGELIDTYQPGVRPDYFEFGFHANGFFGTEAEKTQLQQSGGVKNGDYVSFSERPISLSHEHSGDFHIALRARLQADESKILFTFDDVDPEIGARVVGEYSSDLGRFVLRLGSETSEITADIADPTQWFTIEFRYQGTTLGCYLNGNEWFTQDVGNSKEATGLVNFFLGASVIDVKSLLVSFSIIARREDSAHYYRWLDAPYGGEPWQFVYVEPEPEPEPEVAPTILTMPSFSVASEYVGNTVTMTLGTAEGNPIPESTFAVFNGNTNVTSLVNDFSITPETPGTYTLSVTWSNGVGEDVIANANMTILSIPVDPEPEPEPVATFEYTVRDNGITITSVPDIVMPVVLGGNNSITVSA